MANSIEWRQPTVTRAFDVADEVFMNEGVPVLTPETFDSVLATEELERILANAGEPERGLEAEELNRLYYLSDNTTEVLRG